MKMKTKQIKKGSIIFLIGKKWTVESIETSDIGKQGTKKCRLELKNENGEKMVIIRPEDYPLDI